MNQVALNPALAGGILLARAISKVLMLYYCHYNAKLTKHRFFKAVPAPRVVCCGIRALSANSFPLLDRFWFAGQPITAAVPSTCSEAANEN